MDHNFPVHHVIVVGFHHKKGCQVEYAFPCLEVEIEKTAWKYLPTLAMPDGAHNYDHDTVYFHLPSLKNPKETVFGVACYQQIDSNKLINKPDDVTRSTVQKSVCILSKYPLYGHIQVKMQLITAAYFREGDFDQVSILEEAFHNLNACLVPELLKTPEAFVGLSPRELVFTFRHQTLLLFKLLLLEKRILFHGPSVGPLCSSLLSLVSLLPLCLEFGLTESACLRRGRGKTLSIVPQFSHEEEEEEEEGESEGGKKNSENPEVSAPQTNRTSESVVMNRGGGGENEKYESEDNTDRDNTAKVYYRRDSDDVSIHSPPKPLSQSSTLSNLALSAPDELNNVDDLEFGKCIEVPDFLTAVSMSPPDAGFPLSLFTNGYLCHPYLSLHYMDLLSNERVRGFIVGSTNILFKQKKELADVVIEMQDGSIEILDPTLRKLALLTTEDLRFAENIWRQVTFESSRRSDSDSFLDGVGWKGGDEWIRAQFKYYLLCLLRTTLTESGGRGRESFGAPYLSLVQNTRFWREWNEYVNGEERETPGVYAICPGHPCDGGMSVSDMKIRLSHTMQNSESGRRLNQAVASTGKAVLQTGKAVGGAINSAKGVFSSWWTTVTTGAISTNALGQDPIVNNATVGGGES